jgi:hypothetical protein
MASISRTRAWSALGLCAAAVILVAACSSGGKSASTESASSEQTPQQALLLAATQTQQITSATETLAVKGSGASGSTTTGTMQIQLKPTLLIAGNLHLTAAGSSQQIKMIVNPTTIYFDDPSLNGQFGEPWVEVDLSALGTEGANFAQAFHSLQSNDFTEQAQLSSVATNTRVVGTQTVDGVPTTEYAGSVKAADALKALPASFRQAVAPELQAMGNSTIYFREWVDGQHHMRKLSEVETVNGNTINTTIDVTAINQPVHITLPPASQTYHIEGSSSVSGTSGSGGLGAKIVPAPPGFTAASVPGTDTGPVNAAGFNQITGAGTAVRFQFVRGYGAGYISTRNSDVIVVFLFQFATSADAAAVEAGSLAGAPAPSKADPIIPGAFDYDATIPSNGTYSHGVIGSRGNVAFLIDEQTGSAAPVPVVETMARQQYAAL